LVAQRFLVYLLTAAAQHQHRIINAFVRRVYRRRWDCRSFSSLSADRILAFACRQVPACATTLRRDKNLPSSINAMKSEKYVMGSEVPRLPSADRVTGGVSRLSRNLRRAPQDLPKNNRNQGFGRGFQRRVLEHPHSRIGRKFILFLQTGFRAPASKRRGD